MNKRLLDALKRTGSANHKDASERKAGVIDNPKAYKRHAKHKKRIKEEEQNIHSDE